MMLAMQYPASRPQISGVFLRLKTWLSSKGVASRIILSIAGIAIGILLIVQLLARINFQDAPEQLKIVGVFGFALALFPYTLITLLDSMGWRRLLARRIPFRTAFNIRSATEALVICAPMGSVLSDPAKALLLKKRKGMPLSQTTPSIVLRKFLLMFGQGVVAFAVAVAAWFFSGTLNVHDLPAGMLTALLSVGGAMAVCGVVFAALVNGTSLLRRLQRFALKIKSSRFQHWMLAKEAHFEELHQNFEHLGGEGKRDVLIAAAEYVALWTLELFETYIMLRVLGIDISFTQAGVIEAACTLMRAAAFMVPGGIGVQDTGYASLLMASGVHSPSVAAFILLKRLREMLWAVLGFSLLFADRRQLAAIADVS
jgi:uncharacterized protein (TIRG00374 family)